MVYPKKRLGQHFLTDPAIALRIVESLDAESEDTVIEIGPGKGVLTSHLMERNFRNFIAVEIDTESVEYLLQKWPDLDGKLISEDFLKLDLNRFTAQKISVIGNLPYNISSQILFHILEHRDLVDSVVCMVQKEVAQRIASPPGSREYGILSVLLQAFYKCEYLFSVKPGSFFPPPKVTSGVMRMTRNETEALLCDEKLFFRVVKACFNQRRKIIRNPLKTILVNLEGDLDLLAMRPEQLSVSQFIDLTNWVSERLPEKNV